MASYDPVFAAEARIDAEEEAWEQLRSESVCRDCLWCAVPEEKWFSNPGKIAYCTNDDIHEFIHWNDRPVESECDFFQTYAGW